LPKVEGRTASCRSAGTSATSCSTSRMPIPSSVVRPDEDLAEGVGLRFVEARRGARRGGGTGNCPAMARAISTRRRWPGGEVADGDGRQVGDPAALQRCFRPSGGTPPVSWRVAAAWRHHRSPARRASRPRATFLQHRHGVEELHPLERPAETGVGPVRRAGAVEGCGRRAGQCRQPPPRRRCRRLKIVGLAGAVGPD